jgi:hypothetical protein
MSDAIALLTTASIRAGGVLVGALVVTLVLRKASASARHMVWTCAVTAALLMPVMLQLPAWRMPMPAIFAGPATADPLVPAIQTASHGTRVPTQPDAALPAGPDRASAAAARARSLTGAAVLLIWLLGCNAVLLYMFVGVLNTLRLRKAAVDARAPWVADGRALAGAAGIRRVAFVESADVTVPFASGVISAHRDAGCIGVLGPAEGARRPAARAGTRQAARLSHAAPGTHGVRDLLVQPARLGRGVSAAGGARARL